MNIKSENINSLYDKYYYDHCCGVTYVRNDHWMSFFNGIAKSIQEEINPSTVLDAGCAKGFLVEAMRSLDIQAWGIDVSAFAITHVHESIQEYCSVQSLTIDLVQDYSLITCIEVLEHMPEKDAKAAIKNMCSHSQDILFSSSPNDYKEATHINVHPPEYWVEQFARYGFFRDLDFDASFLTPWAIRFRYSADPGYRIISQYERKLSLLIRENNDLRESTLQLQSQVSGYKTQLEQTQSQLEQTQSQLEQTQSQLEQTQSQLEQTQSQLKIAQSELVDIYGLIAAMESSKFWKIRKLWFASKKALHLGRISRFLHLKLPKAKQFTDSYQSWIHNNEPTFEEIKQQHIREKSFQFSPLISIILPVYKVPTKILFETLQSVINQSYTNWEVCIALADLENKENLDLLVKLSKKDSRFKIKILHKNLGISGNSDQALELSKGEFIALLDHDDTLVPYALFMCVEKLNSDPTIDFLYSDKDCIDESGKIRSRLLLKPEWSPEILYSANYLTHLCIIRRTLVSDIGGFNSETDGAQDWDLFFRVSEKTSKIARVEGVLYHWRIIEGSTSLGMSSKPYAATGQLQTIRQHLFRAKLPAHAIPHPESGFHIQWLTQSTGSIIIVDGNVSFEELSSCLKRLSKFEKVELHEIKVLISSQNFSTNNYTIRKIEKNLSYSIDWILIDKEAEVLKLINKSISEINRSSIIFLSGKIQNFSNNWVEELIGWVNNNPNIGFTSALVLTQDNIVVEAGLVVDQLNNIYPLFRGEPIHHYGIFGGPLWYRNCDASSPWAVAFNYQDYKKACELFSSTSCSWSDSITQLCQIIRKQGKRGMVNPHCRAFLSSLPEFNSYTFDDSIHMSQYFHPQLSPTFPLTLKIQ